MYKGDNKSIIQTRTLFALLIYNVYYISITALCGSRPLYSYHLKAIDICENAAFKIKD
jgi:hypothetical protein